MSDRKELKVLESIDGLDPEGILLAIQEHAPIRVYIKNRSLQFVFATSKTAETHGLELNELLGLTDRDLFTDEIAERYMELDRKVIEKGSWRMLREEERHPDGTRLVIQSYKIPLPSPNRERGEIVGLLGITLDVTVDHRERERVIEEARTDPLTGLANRRAAEEYLSFRLAEAKRYKKDLQILMLDLDEFKRINDSHGRAAGDEVLQRFARRLKSALRETDHISRWGGDEFLVVSPERDDLGVLIKRLQDVLARPIQFGYGLSARVTVSVGKAHYPEDGADQESLLEAADSNMYQNKENDKG